MNYISFDQNPKKLIIIVWYDIILCSYRSLEDISKIQETKNPTTGTIFAAHALNLTWALN